MKLHSQPILKYCTKDRLHICKQPGLVAWMSVFSINSFGILFDYYIIPDYFVLHAAFLSLCLIFSLNFIKTWDLIMDKEENLGTIISKNWYHIFSIKVPEENVLRFPLSKISSVIVSSDNTIDIKRKNETSLQIISEGYDYRSLKNLREEISIFLCLERIENLKETGKAVQEWDFDSWSNISGFFENPDSDNETQEDYPIQRESPFYGSNIKIITGVL